MHPRLARIADGWNDLRGRFTTRSAFFPEHEAMVVFDHEKLEVYRVAVEYADAADTIAAKMKRGNAHIRDQLRRASDSIVNNVAEGAGEFQPAEKARFYRNRPSLVHRERRDASHLPAARACGTRSHRGRPHPFETGRRDADATRAVGGAPLGSGPGPGPGPRPGSD